MLPTQTQVLDSQENHKDSTLGSVFTFILMTMIIKKRHENDENDDNDYNDDNNDGADSNCSDYQDSHDESCIHSAGGAVQSGK